MQSPFAFIVTPLQNKRYDNTIDVGSVEFITSTSKEDASVSNRFALVVEVPLGYKGPIQKEDILVVHHNVFKYYNDMAGREKSGRSFLKDDTFFVEQDQFFMYNHKGKWLPHLNYCFVKPVEREKSSIFKLGTYEPLTGYLKYINKSLKDSGLKEGDKVGFLPNSEYKFTIDGELLYRMKTSDIAIKL